MAIAGESVSETPRTSWSAAVAPMMKAKLNAEASGYLGMSRRASTAGESRSGRRQPPVSAPGSAVVLWCFYGIIVAWLGFV